MAIADDGQHGRSIVERRRIASVRISRNVHDDRATLGKVRHNEPSAGLGRLLGAVDEDRHAQAARDRFGLTCQRRSPTADAP